MQLKLFVIFFRMGLFTFGGGYAMVPIMERELIDEQALIEREDFLDYLSLAQSFPGPIAVNLSLLLGYKLYGLVGAITALVGVVLPSFLVIIAISLLYSKTNKSILLRKFFAGLYPVIPALLLFSFWNLIQKLPLRPLNLLLLFVTFLGVALYKINPLYFILGGVLIGLCSYFSNSTWSSSK